MSKHCRVCNVMLDKTNCCKSFLDRNFSICRKCNQQQMKSRYKKYRRIIMERLGNKCECCGIDTYELLSIDHIYGGGNKERKSASRRSGSFINKLYYMPINDLLAKFRCLCFNCNCANGYYGVCPHTIQHIKIDPGELLVIDYGNDNRHLIPAEHKRRRLNVRKIRYIKTKLEMIRAYGGQCVQCSETQPLFLVLDHIHNNGYLEHYEGNDFYRYLKRMGYPGRDTQLQLLCHNCNSYKEYRTNRAQNNIIIKTTPEIYIAQKYYISKEDNQQLKDQANYIFHHCLAGIKDKNASVLPGSTSTYPTSEVPKLP